MKMVVSAKTCVLGQDVSVAGQLIGCRQDELGSVQRGGVPKSWI